MRGGEGVEKLIGKQKLEADVMVDFDAIDSNLKEVIRLRNELVRAMYELYASVAEAPLLTLAKENPAQSK